MNSVKSGFCNPDTSYPQDQKEFLENIIQADKDNLLEIRAISTNGKSLRQFFSKTDEALDYIQSYNGKNNIYFGLTSRKDDKSGNKDNCKSLNALFIDIDCGHEGHKKESVFTSKSEAIKFIHKIDFPSPSIIVDSGNGYHLYWLLEKQYIFDSRESINYIESLLKQISLLYGADATYDISRIFRVPGTLNLKTSDPKVSSICFADYAKRYSLITLRNNPLLNLRLQDIKSTKEEYYRLLFGNISNFETDDRSRIDQSFITMLVGWGFDDKQIEQIFNNFPITGKYSAHSSPEKYLEHSISNAREYIENNSAQIKRSETESVDDKKFRIEKDKESFGYHRMNSKSEWERISNFIVEFNPRIQIKRNEETLSYYSGRIIFYDKEYPFDKFESTLLVDNSGFNKFIANYTGTEGEVLKTTYTQSAIKFFNRFAGLNIEREYGFTPDLDQYITESFIVEKDQINYKDTPIKNKEFLPKNNKLMLLDNTESFNFAKEGLNRIMSEWDKPEKIIPIVSFTFLPIIYPYIKDAFPKKSYMLIQGTTGCGKSDTATWMQSFYGKIHNLPPWNSTFASLNQMGSAHKDCLFVIDDLKNQNFSSERDLNQALALLQNYADNNSRHRSNKNLRLMDEYKIEGHLFLTGEDIVFTESSTIARGIIINVDTKPTNFELVGAIKQLSSHFPAFTTRFIQQVMSIYDKKGLLEIISNAREIINTCYNSHNLLLDMNNYDRVANNFAQLITSWMILNNYLNEQNLINEESINKNFNLYFKELMDYNLNLVTGLRSDDLFENLLWDGIESGKLHLIEINSNGESGYRDDRTTYIGHYHKSPKNEITLILNLGTSLEEIKKYNKNITVHKTTLTNKLVSQGKIEKTINDKKWSINGYQVRGVKWTGKIPSTVFNTPEDVNPKIANNSKSQDEEISNRRVNNSIGFSESNERVILPEGFDDVGYKEEFVKVPDTPNFDEITAAYEEALKNEIEHIS